MSSPPRSSRRGGGGGGGSSNSKTDASHLLNFRTAGPPPGAISSSAASSPQRRNHRRNNRAGGDTRDKHDASLRAERRARRALSSAFYLHASSSHAFVLSNEARGRLRRQQGHDPKQRHHYGPDTGMRWDDVRMVEWLVETTATAGGSGGGAGARATTVQSTSSSSSPLSCPICLDDSKSARMARCGHSFCYPCILRHLYTDGSGGTGSSGRDVSSPVRKCPCCSEPLRIDDLRPVIFRSVAPPHINRIMRFRRLCRPRGKCVARLSNAGDESDGSFAKESREGTVSAEKRDDDDYDSFPLVSDPSAPFCRYSHLDHGQEAYTLHLRSDLAALREAERDAPLKGGVDATEAAFVRMASEAVGLELSAAKQEVEKATMGRRLGSGCLSEAGGHEDDDTNRHRQRSSSDSRHPDGDEVADGDGGAVTQFYQAEDGQLCFLSSFNMLCLNAEYGGGKQGDDGSRCGTRGSASGDHASQTGAASPNPPGTQSRGGKQKKQQKKKQQRGQHNVQPPSPPLPECPLDPPSSPEATRNTAEKDDFDKVFTGQKTSTSSALDGGCSPRRQGEVRDGNRERQLQEEQPPDDRIRGNLHVSSSSENARRRHLPDLVEGQVVDVETVHLTADARKRYTFLSHLPLYVDVKFVEVHLGPKVLGEATRRRFKAEMDRRKKKRRGKAQAEKKRDQAASKSARERELKERQQWQGQAVDWNEEFFRSGTGSPPSSPLSDDFGPKLAGISGDGDSNSNRQPDVTAVRPNHPIATPPRADDAVFSFRAVCATNGVWPGLMGATTTPVVTGSPVKSIVSTESTGTGKRPVVSGAWGSRGARRSTANSESGVWKCAASAVEETTLPPPTLPDGSPSRSAEKPRGKGAKGKGKHKVLLFSTGGHRGSYGYG